MARAEAFRAFFVILYLSYNSKYYIHFAEKASYQFPYLDWEVKRDDDDRSPFSLGASENLFKR